MHATQSNRRIFLRQLGLGTAGISLVSFLPGCRTGQPASQGQLLRSTPEAQGVSSAGILAFLDAAQKSRHELHSFMLLRHGLVVAEGWWTPYGPDLNHALYSLSKSFTSTAIGLAVAEGRLRVEDRVVSFFPKDRPETVSDLLASMRVKDLLTMSAGQDKEPSWELVKQDDWVKSFLAWPVNHTPGSRFLYNSAATYMLSAILRQLTGQRLLDYLTPRLFAPLGIEGMTWESCPRGIDVGGWGLGIRTEGLAKFGQLYLQKGVWQGRQILPASWVEEATRLQIQQAGGDTRAEPKARNDWLQGYGYQFWRCQHNAFRGDGAFGQYTIVLPEQDAVIAMTGECSNMQAQLDLVWEHLLPAMKDYPQGADQAAQAQLQRTLSTLRLAPPQGQITSPASTRIVGKTFKLAPNESGLVSASFLLTNQDCFFTLKDGQTGYPIRCGLEQWVRGNTDLPGTPPRLISGGTPPKGTLAKVAASATWKDANTLELMLRYYETPHHDSITCRFDGNQVQISFLNSLAKMSANPKDSRPILQGVMV